MTQIPFHGNRIINIEMPTDFSHENMHKEVAKQFSAPKSEFHIEILRQSLDARSKNNPHWKIRAVVWSETFSATEHISAPAIEFPQIGNKRRVIVIGSGPAGYFCALFAARSGFQVTIIEQGPNVEKRWQDVLNFEANSKLQEFSNYVCGEGGAGTFSDGKLTSRTKGIDVERNFIFKTYIEAGAPPEIDYLAHPHIGSNHLRKIMPKLREMFQNAGGEILFNCTVTDFENNQGSVRQIGTSQGFFEAEFFVFACGHSSMPAYRTLLGNGVRFAPKPFAIGMRVELPQQIVNEAQFRRKSLPGVKAAEYFLTTQAELPVYSFCMCPGGKVVPAMTQPGTLVVNGVSNYERNGAFANSAIVAGVDLRQLVNPEISAIQCLEWRENIERTAHKISSGTHNFAAPASRVTDFIQNKISLNLPNSTYPFPLVPDTYQELLPNKVLSALRTAMSDFSKKLHGFDQGILIGVETTTSAPIRTERDNQRRCVGFSNLFVAGEMSGWSGGIVSSAVDGIKVAQAICRL